MLHRLGYLLEKVKASDPPLTAAGREIKCGCAATLGAFGADGRPVIGRGRVTKHLLYVPPFRICALTFPCFCLGMSTDPGFHPLH